MGLGKLVLGSPNGSVYFCGTEPDLFMSRRLIRARLELYSNILTELNKTQKAMAADASRHLKRLMHNLLTQNAHNIQEVYNVVPQDVLGLAMNEQIENVRRRMQADTTTAAKALLRINKNNVAMKSEFAAFKFLYEPDGGSLRRRAHKVHKLLMNALHPFFQDFREKDVYVEVDDCDASVTADYETIQVALHHLIDNAVKYTFPSSRVRVTFPVVKDRQAVLFDMVSVQITDVDARKMFDEGYSGVHPRQISMAGAGLGMGMVRTLLKLNGAEIEVHRNVDASRKQNALLCPYENNQFVVIMTKPF
jgi:K+-sensing histidine kinase KdpD